ncbi:hypothetical protein V2I68_04170 [Pseudomonas viridiflava]|uniref:Uncharacterized protein n=1 Tax=Pseudomonas viridiflava TaxID=33069 RepID=A0ABU7N348_PSEVI|nr:hypothetical protein [Pseudomonas syringae]MEE3934740.1 hypothetical protein [Pseudomonas viridiflava]MEE4039256.1 hypothetical protein [Pseudomonas viridiflava]MEE4059119.1 hypothetical protein [Pseudomonas viridiflava]MEE4167986.1 hypothetical protein [Pseudomonas viridiflava]
MLKIVTGSLLLIAALLMGQSALADGPAAKRPLFLFLFLHDDVREHDLERLAKDYITWFVKDLESFTHRRVQLEFIRHVPTVTDFAYKGDDLDRISLDFRNRVDQYINARNLPNNPTTKYMLLTQDMINREVGGVALIKGYTAIASLATYNATAHELGHMLDGTHEAAEVLYRGGWWCETNMLAVRNQVRANCYIYSNENKRRIEAHLSQYP